MIIKNSGERIEQHVGLIAQIAIEHHLTLLHHDHGFLLIQTAISQFKCFDFKQDKP